MPRTASIRPLLRACALLAALAAGAPAAGSTPGRALPGDLMRDVALLEARIDSDLRRVHAPALEAYLGDVLCRLDRQACGGLRVRVLREPGFNAAVAPGGLLVLRTGALLRCRDEAELALVLAHELAHERRGDARQRWHERVAGDGDAHAAARALAAERQADADAIAMVAAAGYDLAAGERLWSRLLAEESGDRRGRGKGGTHPLSAERLAAFSAARAAGGDGAGPGETATGRWQAQMAPFRLDWLETEAALGDPERTLVMLEASRAAGPSSAEVDFALAQALRRRGGPGDRERALALYEAVLATPDPPAAAWREAGLARLARGEITGREALRHYLALAPSAADAGFVAAMLGDDAPTASAPVARAGEARVKQWKVFDLRLRSALRWTRQRGIGLEQWTLDGTGHDRMLLVPNLRPGEPLFRGAGRGGPEHRAGLRPDELRDQVVRALHASGWLIGSADGPRRHDFGTVEGWRSELVVASADGRPHRGTVLYAERAGRLTLLLWLASAESGSTRDPGSIEAMLASVRFAD